MEFKCWQHRSPSSWTWEMQSSQRQCILAQRYSIYDFLFMRRYFLRVGRISLTTFDPNQSMLASSRNKKSQRAATHCPTPQRTSSTLGIYIIDEGGSAPPSNCKQVPLGWTATPEIYRSRVTSGNYIEQTFREYKKVPVLQAGLNLESYLCKIAAVWCELAWSDCLRQIESACARHGVNVPARSNFH